MIDAVNMYIVEKGEYPQNSNFNACLTADSSCSWVSSIPYSEGLHSKLAKYNTLASSVPTTSTTRYAGISIYITETERLMGLSRPVLVTYVLDGAYQKCQLTNITGDAGFTPQNSTSGYTIGNVDGATVRCCWY